MTRCWLSIWVFICVGCLGTFPAAGESRQLIDVLDRLGRTHNCVLGLDPAVNSRTAAENVSVDAGEDWYDSLQTALDVLGLTCVKGATGKFVITKSTTLALHAGLGYIGGGDLSAAEKSFAEALKLAPDDIGLIALRQFCTDVRREQDEVVARTNTLQVAAAELDAAWRKTTAEEKQPKNVRELTQALIDAGQKFRESWAAFQQAAWRQYSRAKIAGLGAELLPLLELLTQKESELLAKLGEMGQMDDDVEMFAFREDSVARLAARERLLDWLHARGKRADLLLSRAQWCLQRDRHDMATRLLKEAVLLNPGKWELRVELATVLATRRHSQAVPEVSAPQEQDSVDVTARLNEWLATDGKRLTKHERRVLNHVAKALKSDVRLPVLRARQSGRLGMVQVPAARTNGLAQVSVVTLETNLEARSNRSTAYQLAVDGDRSWSSELAETLFQALTWVDNRTDNKLHDFAVQITFPQRLGRVHGDSVGAGLALAAFSSAYELTPDPDAVVFGGIRAYGAVAATTRIEASLEALREADVRLAIVPADNRPDLDLASDASLRGVRVLLANTMDDVIRHACPGQRSQKWAQANDAFVAGQIYEQCRRPNVALACYEHALALVPEDYSSGHATQRLLAAGAVATELPTWLRAAAAADDVPVFSMGASRDQALQHDLAAISEFVALLATEAAEVDEPTDHVQALIEFALHLNPENPRALLLKGQLAAGREVTPLEDKIQAEPGLDDVFMRHAQRGLQSTDAQAQRIGRLLVLMVLDHIAAEHNEALIEFGRWGSAKTTLADALKNLKLTAPSADAARATVSQVAEPKLKSVNHTKYHGGESPEAEMWAAIQRGFIEGLASELNATITEKAAKEWWHIQVGSDCSGEYRVVLVHDGWYDGKDFDTHSIVVTPGKNHEFKSTNGTKYRISMARNCGTISIDQLNRGRARTATYKRDESSRYMYRGTYRWNRRVREDVEGYLIVKRIRRARATKK